MFLLRSLRRGWLIVLFSGMLAACSPAIMPPTLTLIPDPTSESLPQFPSQCDQTGNTYQLQWLYQDISVPDGAAPHQGQTAPSPDGRYTAYMDGYGSGDLMIEPAGGTARPLLRLEYWQDFRAWSPDGEYVLVRESQEHYLSLWSVTSGKRAFATTGLYVSAYSWSPDSRWLAFLWRDDAAAAGGNTFPPARGLTLAAVDGSAEYAFPIMGIGVPGDFRQNYIVWSPDSQSVAIQYYSGEYLTDLEKPGVFRVDGTAVPDVLRLSADLAETGLSESLPLIWSEDSRLLSFVTLRGNADSPEFNMTTYTPASGDGEVRVITANLLRAPFYAPDKQHVAVYEDALAQKTITVMQLDGANPTPLVSQAADAGDPDWSLDGRYVAAVWAAGNGDERQVRLTWMQPDGSGRQDVSGAFRDIRELRWMRSGAALAYLVWWGEAGNSIEIADTATGERHELVSRIDTITDIQYDPDSDILSWWWQDGSSWGKDAFRSDGTPVYHLLAAGGFERQPRSEFWSPEGDVLALKLGRIRYGKGGPDAVNADESLVLVYADGRLPVVVRSGLSGLGDPLWSPDGRYLAFTQSINRGPVSFEIITANGADVWRDAAPPEYTFEWLWTKSGWIPCP
ncbi:MAG: hypothetical protein K8I60_00785 [Anaerolineae bacterium]|nr:hypothetical protein [Anaerolineae bacterium]